ncbi:MAG: hypothetical protein JWM86_12 [Thermoleophilia bacterium]|nr:hypothetical protein [Thermoleophilia bacterium]
MGVTTTATATFVIDSWEERDARTHGGAAVGRAELAKTFSGDIVGTSRVDMLGVTAEDEQSRAYVALEEFDVAVDGRAGTFVLVHHGIMGGTNDGGSWTIAPGSGSGELSGISGTAQLVRHDDGSHELVLEYSLGPEA